jgi:hypothetical protein
MQKLKLLTTLHYPYGVTRTYQHSELGLLPVVTIWGAGSADIITITTVWARVYERNERRAGRIPYAAPVTKKAKRRGNLRRDLPPADLDDPLRHPAVTSPPSSMPPPGPRAA